MHDPAGQGRRRPDLESGRPQPLGPTLLAGPGSVEPGPERDGDGREHPVADESGGLGEMHGSAGR